MTKIKKSFTEYFDHHSGSKILFFAGIAIHVLFLLSLGSGFLNPLFLDSTYCSGRGADFYSIYQSAQNFRNHQSIYDTQPQTQSVPYFYEYRYLPFTALTIGQIFLFFTPQHAYIIWLVIQELCLIVNIMLTRQYLIKPAQRNIASSLWLLFTPYYLELYMGQFSFVMATLIFSMVYFWQKKRIVIGNLLWTLSILIKTFTVILIPVAIKIKNSKSVVWVLLIVISLSLPYFILQPGTLDSFLKNINEGLSSETIDGNQGFEALLGVILIRTSDLSYYLHENSSEISVEATDYIQLPLLLWTIVIYGASLFITMKSSHKYAFELFYLWILTYFLTYKHIWEHHYVLLLPLFIFIFIQYSRQEPKYAIPKSLFWTGFSITALPSLFIFLDKHIINLDCEYSWSGWESILWHSPKPLICLIIYICLIKFLYRTVKTTNPTQTRRSPA
jgi:hypothetical protein